jgi:hypothetical protein
MTRAEAKAILQVYRPSGRDAGDADFKAALAMVEADPELAQWFAAQQAFDLAMGVHLKSVPVPAGLAESLRALPGSAAVAVAPPGIWSRCREALAALLRKPVLPERWLVELPLWRHWQVRVAFPAAALLIGGLIMFWGASGPRTFGDFRESVMASCWDSEKHLDLASSDLGQIREWMFANGVETNFALPPALAQQHVMGARVLNWDGDRVAFICFLSGPAHLHLLVTDKRRFPDAPAAGSPQFAESKGWHSASWTQGDHAYVLSGMRLSTFVRKFRKAGQWMFETSG